jgi:hypothetical protein
MTGFIRFNFFTHLFIYLSSTHHSFLIVSCLRYPFICRFGWTCPSYLLSTPTSGQKRLLFKVYTYSEGLDVALSRSRWAR